MTQDSQGALQGRGTQEDLDALLTAAGNAGHDAYLHTVTGVGKAVALAVLEVLGIEIEWEEPIVQWKPEDGPAPRQAFGTIKLSGPGDG